MPKAILNEYTFVKINNSGQCLIVGVVQSFKSNAIFVIKGAEVKAVSRMSHHVRGCLFEVMKAP